MPTTKTNQNSAAGLVGTVLGGVYRIEGLLGEGGMGAVYAAIHLRLRRQVAIKIIARDLVENDEALLRFDREALVTSGLGHPHIVQVFDLSTMPTGEPFMVMEFLEGEDLDARLRREQRLLPVQMLHIVRQVASALSAAHAKGIVHRDLKPANIYLLKAAEEADFVKVLDFGISKVRAATTKLTRAQAVMGTPDFMSPEQALGKIDEIDERTDQWALACIAWQCLSGRPPFIGVNAPSLLFQVVHERPNPLTPRVPGLPSQVEEVLLKALAKQKADRFPSVSAFVSALELSLAGSIKVTGEVLLTSRTAELPVPEHLTVPDVPPVACSPTAKPPTTFMQTAGELGGKSRRLSTRRRWQWLAVAAAALVLGLAGFLGLRPRPAPVPTAPAVAPPAPTARPEPAFEPPAAKTEPPPAVVPDEEAALALPTALVGLEQPAVAQAGEGSAAGGSAGRPALDKSKAAPRRKDGSKPGPRSARPRVERKLIEDL